jgi:uridine kinase
VRQHRLVTFWRRLARDLRERRKPPMVLLRRGWSLLRDQNRVVAHAVARGCRAMTPDQAYADVQRLRARQPSDE